MSSKSVTPLESVQRSPWVQYLTALGGLGTIWSLVAIINAQKATAATEYPPTLGVVLMLSALAFGIVGLPDIRSGMWNYLTGGDD